MSMWINSVVTLLFTVKCVSARNVDLYEIPIPDIIVFSTGGLRISIPETYGISVFRFHANINEEIQPLRQGTINLATHQQSAGGNWILEIKNPLFKPGDVIFYWIFVRKDRLGYVKQPHSYKVTELVPYYGVDLPNIPQESILPNIPNIPIKPSGSHPLPPPQNFPIVPPKLPLSTTRSAEYYPTAPSTQNFPKPSILTTTTTPIYYSTTTTEKIKNNHDYVIVHNNTESVTALQIQVDSLSEKVDLLIGILEKLPNAKKLTISGRIPDDENPAATVRFFLWDKLDLKPKIVSAERNKDGSITFETATLEEKTLVLMLSKEKLQNATISIF